ncbi:CaiB/BaiF CoA transferase family protein [Gordonia sp. KTR9]|uniref:CaiB/BaiF CoA transferase family protein n=1 Tax=Gordonia sp. KTR9 TaxID=337191 RepID=UPI00027DE65C|nr:CoA transferase [Gordonia sp. KTR9]AFR49809.1 putative acyl-CoA transferases/carnitine dehydratase [Gordonia sp. KTR9]
MTAEVSTGGEQGLFDGVIVVDLTRALAGPHATMMLADLGARVIKVEPPHGDESRGWGPPFVGNEPISTYFLSCNRNKESVTADLKSSPGQQLLSDLIRVADVLIENFRPGVLARLGFDEDTLRQLNPRLILCSLSGFGHDGPESQRPGYDQIVQGEAGLMSLTGPDPSSPTKVGVPIADLLTGMNGAFAIAAALFDAARRPVPRGRTVRTSLLAGVVGVHAYQGTRVTIAGQSPRAQGNRHPSIAPYGMFHTADGPVQISVGNEATWQRFCDVIGLDSADPTFADNERRVRSVAALDELINDRLSTADADHWLKRLADAAVPAGKVRSLEQVYEWEQTRSQGLVIEVDHPDIGPVELTGSPIRVDDRHEAGTRDSHSAPPRLGEHNDSVRRWLDEQLHQVS